MARAAGLHATLSRSLMQKAEAKPRGVHAETFAYWYLRRQGHLFWRGTTCRVVVMAIEEVPGESPVVRLHKAAVLSTEVNRCL